MSLNSLNSLLDKAMSVANVAGKKTEEMVEVSKLKLPSTQICRTAMNVSVRWFTAAENPVWIMRQRLQKSFRR